MVRPGENRGFTLPELLILAVLISVVFAGMASIYITSVKFFNSQMNAETVNPAMALEHIARKVNLANNVLTVSGGKQLNVRIDAPSSLVPYDPPTPATADDTWVMYGIFTGSLRWKITTDPNAVVTVADPEVVPKLNVSNASSFSIVNPSSAKAATVVQMNLISVAGSPPRNITLISDAAAKALSK